MKPKTTLKGFRKEKIKGKIKRFRKQKMCMSEIMTIIIYFHLSNIRTFKHYLNLV